MTGRFFFYNGTSGKVQWERPSAVADAAERARQMALLESGPSGGGDDGGGDDGGEKSDSGSDTAASALPDGWRAMNDETTGRTYFFHAESGESKWERPSEKRDAKIAAQEKRLRDNPWKKQTDEEGRTFYWNKISGVSQWTAPADFVDPDDTSDEAWSRRRARSTTVRAAGDWSEMNDGATGNTYWYNAKTGESTWLKPAEIEAAQAEADAAKAAAKAAADVPAAEAAAAEAAAAEATDEDDDGGADSDESDAAWTRRRGRSTVVDALSGWECFKDPKTGKNFWWHAETGESTWDTPAATWGARRRRSLTKQTRGDWEQLFDPETERDFWYNKKTGISQWATPREALLVGFGGMGAISDGDEDHDEDDNDDEEEAEEKDNGTDDSKAAWAKRRARSVWTKPIAGNDEWETMKDPITNRVFFYSKKTGVSQWPVNFLQNTISDRTRCLHSYGLHPHSC